MLTLSYLEHCTVLPCALCDPLQSFLLLNTIPFMNPWVLEKLPWFNF